MAALDCPSNMAAVVNAMEEYVQVVVGEDCDPSQMVMVQGGGSELPVQELSPEILRSISQSDTVFYVQPDGSLVPGGSLHDVQSRVRLVTGGQEVEAAHSELRLLTRGHMEEDAVSMVTGGHVVEAVQSEMRLETGDPVEEAVQCAVNLVTRAQVMEAVHPGMILVPGGHIEEAVHPGVNLVSRGQVMEAVQSGMRLVDRGNIEEPIHYGVSQANGGQVHPDMDVDLASILVEEGAHPDMGTALNLTKEAAQHSVSEGGRAHETMTPEVSLVCGAPQGNVQSQSLPAASSGASIFPSPVPVLKDSAQQLKTVAHHVALSEGDVTRIINHKQLKSIQVQVPSLQAKKSTDSVVLNLSTVHMKNASPSLLGAQVVQIKSLSESGPPLVVNSSSQESPIQILVRQSQLPTVKPRTPDPSKNAGGSLEEHRSCVAHPQNGAHTLCTVEHAHTKGHKRKKSIKIKTRSGRISRPPKHKAKDYKFLKVGDLIQGSTSDSEDYSELSTDEDEKGAKENAPHDVPPYTVKNTLFQCQMCEKSYMGKGGLSRHYRLYPSHGQMEAQLVSDTKRNGESGVSGHVLPSEAKKPTSRPRKRLLEDPLNPVDSSLPTLVRDGLEFVPVSTTCRGRRQITGKRFGRPQKILAIASSEQNALTAKELIKQCEDKDLKEHVAPCVSERLSVYDFLLVKVKQEHPDKPLFPHMYKELEKLQSMVRTLAQEYFSNGGVGTTLEVADCKMAASLEIPAENIVEVSAPVTSSATEEQRINSTRENNDCLVEVMMPPSKRLKLEESESASSTKDVNKGNAPDNNEAEQRTDLASIADELLCGNDTSSDAAIHCTKQVIETSHSITMEEEVAKRQTNPDPASISCDIEQNFMEVSLPLLNKSPPESGDSTQISSEHPEETLSEPIQTQVIQKDIDAEEVLPGSSTDPCPQASAADPTLPSDAPPSTIAEKTCSDSFQGVDTLFSPDIIASDQCTQAFGYHHEHDLVFVHSSEGTTPGEAVVIYDSTESPANLHLDTVVALVGMK